MKKSICLWSLCALVSLPSVVSAAPATDLSVQLGGPGILYVYEDGTFTATVSNVSNRSAAGVLLTIALPPSATSPTVFPLGHLGSFDSRCSVSGTSLVCALGTMARNTSTAVVFDFAFAHSLATLGLSATVTTTSNENNLSNNSASLTPMLVNYDAVVPNDSLVVNEHCTGSTVLTSFHECACTPSSITSHETLLEAGGGISFPQYQGSGYTGSWYQGSPDHLHVEYFLGPDKVLELDAYEVGDDCFEGVSIFPQNPSYVSPYRICL